MGLAILPARLKEEMSLLKDCLLKKKTIDDYECLLKHKEWFNELSKKDITEDNVDEIIKQGLADVFTSVLEDAGVYKMDEDGIKGFKKFVNYTLKGEIL
jgi:UDPglucose--hexose-1-phosphate uridylyltransferase